SSKSRQSPAGCSKASSPKPSASQSPHFSPRAPLPPPLPGESKDAQSPLSDTPGAATRSPTPATPQTLPRGQGTAAPPLKFHCSNRVPQTRSAPLPLSQRFVLPASAAPHQLRSPSVLSVLPPALRSP